MEIVWVLFLVALAVGAVVWLVYDNSPGSLIFESNRPRRELLDDAVMVFTTGGWTTTTRTGTQATFVRESKASCCLALVLAIIFIVPALVYMILGGKTHTVSVHIEQKQQTVSVVAIAWNRRSSGQRLARALSQLAFDTRYVAPAPTSQLLEPPQVIEAQASTSHLQEPPQPAQAQAPTSQLQEPPQPTQAQAKGPTQESTDIPVFRPIAGRQAPTASQDTNDVEVQLRRLAHLRDEGLITPEEFEAKRKRLIDDL